MAKLKACLSCAARLKVFRDKNFINKISHSKFPQIEVLCSAIWLFTRTIFHLGPYDNFILPCMSKNDLSKGFKSSELTCPTDDNYNNVGHTNSKTA